MTGYDRFGVPSFAAALPLPEVIAILASDARSALDVAPPDDHATAGVSMRPFWLAVATVIGAVGSLSLLHVLPVI